MTGQLPQFDLHGIPVDEIIRQANQSASTVFAMIESADAAKRADEITAVEGGDVVRGWVFRSVDRSRGTLAV
jgi:2-keto-3-deoxy-L-rhamnonate aldolase RhmA